MFNFPNLDGVSFSVTVYFPHDIFKDKMGLYIYIYIYICVCVRVCVCVNLYMFNDTGRSDSAVF